jgi:IS4 transposase
MQRHLKDETLVLAGWIVLISRLPEAVWSDEMVLTLYRARWQIELVFKRMKQIMRLGLVRCRSVASAQATILTWLVAWALQEQQMQSIRACLQALPSDLQAALDQEQASSQPQSGSCAVLSSWRLTAVGVQTLRVQVQGCWTLSRLAHCLPLLHRFLRDSPRRRRQQEQTIRALLPLVMGSALPLDSFFFSYSSA